MSIHFVNTPTVAAADEGEIVLSGIQKQVLNPLFITGVILFATSMFLKANSSSKLAVIPLFISTILLLYSVWKLSANGTVIISKAEQKMIRVYKHLGYIQKVYSTPIQSIDGVILSNQTLSFMLDTGRRIRIANGSEQSLPATARMVAEFLKVELIDKSR